MKPSFLILASCLVLVSAGKAQSQALRYSSYPGDGGYDVLESTVSGVRVQALRISDKYRLSAVGGMSEPTWVLQGPAFNQGLDPFLQICERARTLKIFEAVQAKNNVYKLRGEFLPLHRLKMAELMPGLVDETMYLRKDFNVPLNQEVVGPHLQSIKVDSLALRGFLERQVQLQSQQIWETGQVEIDLTGKDALVCDMVSNSSRIKVVTGLRTPLALPARKAVVSVENMATLIERLERAQPKGKDPIGKVIFRIGVLSRAQKEVLGLDAMELGEEKFIKLAQTLIDLKTGELLIRSNDPEGLQKASRNMDELLDGFSDLAIWVRPVIKVEGTRR